LVERVDGAVKVMAAPLWLDGLLRVPHTLPEPF